MRHDFAVGAGRRQRFGKTPSGHSALWSVISEALSQLESQFPGPPSLEHTHFQSRSIMSVNAHLIQIKQPISVVFRSSFKKMALLFILQMAFLF